MDTTILQVPLSKGLKSNATDVAREYGFSSLQEVVRLFLAKLARKELFVSFGEAPVSLSKAAENRYSKMDKDFDRGRNVNSFSSVGDLMKDLKS